MYIFINILDLVTNTLTKFLFGKINLSDVQTEYDHLFVIIKSNNKLMV